MNIVLGLADAGEYAVELAWINAAEHWAGKQPTP